jgi:hypothetical protein
MCGIEVVHRYVEMSHVPSRGWTEQKVTQAAQPVRSDETSNVVHRYATSLQHPTHRHQPLSDQTITPAKPIL